MRHRLALAFIAVLIASLAGNARSAGAAPEAKVRLPTELDALAFAPNSQTLLYGKGFGIETQLPGPVTDRERVDVGLNLDGSLAHVGVTQRLTLSGLGDFMFKVSGPARDVRALPGTATNPGLRKGAVLWQGFSPGRKVLAAEMELYPRLERDRMPLSFDLAMKAGRKPLRPGRTVSGPFELSLRISNTSGAPIGVAQADADPALLAPVLDRVRAALRRGEQPVPGKGGIPKTVPAEDAPTNKTESIEVPFVVQGRFLFPPGALTRAHADGATVRRSARGTVLAFHSELEGGESNRLSMRLTGFAKGLTGLPKLVMTAEPALPSARALGPPVGSSWATGVATDPSAFDGRRTLSTLLETMWRVARVPQFEAYLGNPDLIGSSQTAYIFRLAPATPLRPKVAEPGHPHAGPVGLAGFSIGVLVLLTGAALAWARS